MLTLQYARRFVFVVVLGSIGGCSQESVAAPEAASVGQAEGSPATKPNRDPVPDAPTREKLKPEAPPYPTGLGLSWTLQTGTRFDAEYMGHQDGKVWLRRSDDQSVIEIPMTDLDEGSRRVVDDPEWMLRLARRTLDIHEGANRPAEWHAADFVVSKERAKLPLELRVGVTALQTKVRVKEMELLKAAEDMWLPLAHELAKLKIEEERLSRQGFEVPMARAKARRIMYETVGINEEIQRLRLTVEQIENSLVTPESITRLLAVDRIMKREMPADVRSVIDQTIALLEQQLEALPEYGEAVRRISDLEKSLMTNRLRLSRQRLDELREQAGRKLDELGIKSPAAPRKQN